MSECVAIIGGVEMVEVYDIQTDRTMLAPKDIADRAELLKKAWIDSCGDVPLAALNKSMGNEALYEAGRLAAEHLHASMVVKPWTSNVEEL